MADPQTPEMLPDTVQLNAWTGHEAAAGDLHSSARRWGSREGLPPSQAPMELPDLVRPENWAHPDVGYGIVLPDVDDPQLSTAAKAGGEDAPEPIRDLLEARPGTVVVRWVHRAGTTKLRRYFSDGTVQDATVGLSKFGTGKGRLPRYLLLVGTPATLPWDLQYTLNTRHAVGRLPFDPNDAAGVEAIGNYVDAMLSAWGDAEVDVTAPLLWTVDHGSGDITSQMRAVIATPLARDLTDPRLTNLQLLNDAAATADGLVDSLVSRPPALLFTSSHGQTAPLDDTQAMAANLGLPVDTSHQPLALDALCDAVPPGCVWFAQACCSAGSDSVEDHTPGQRGSRYQGLLTEGTTAFLVVDAVANIGPSVAPAPLALLGRQRPARAVVGHVEPTFDWTLRVAETSQGLGGHLVSALSTNLHFGQPLGYAFCDYRAGVGELHTQWADARDKFNRGDFSLRAKLTRLRLTAMDRQSLVLLGDPTVTLPPLPGGRRRRA